MVSIGQMKLETQQQLYNPKSRHQDEEQVEEAYQGPGGLCQGQGPLENHARVFVNVNVEVKDLLKITPGRSLLFPQWRKSISLPTVHSSEKEGG